MFMNSISYPVECRYQFYHHYFDYPAKSSSSVLAPSQHFQLNGVKAELSRLLMDNKAENGDKKNYVLYI